MKNLTKPPSVLPSLFSADSLSRTGSQPNMHLAIGSPSKAYTRLSSQHVNTVRTVPDSMEKSLNSYRSMSLTARKPTVEYVQTFDARSMNAQQELDFEFTPADMKSIEAAKAKNEEMKLKSQEARVSASQGVIEGKVEFTLLAEILVAFESVAKTVRDR